MAVVEFIIGVVLLLRIISGTNTYSYMSLAILLPDWRMSTILLILHMRISSNQLLNQLSQTLLLCSILQTSNGKNGFHQESGCQVFGKRKNLKKWTISGRMSVGHSITKLQS